MKSVQSLVLMLLSVPVGMVLIGLAQIYLRRLLK